MSPAAKVPPGPPLYVFVSDQGHVFSSHDEPTAADFGFAGTGIYTIIRLGDLHCYDTREVWRPIPPGALDQAEVGSVAGHPFHAA